MLNPILLKVYFKDILAKVDLKFLNNEMPNDYELFRVINIYDLENYNKLFNKKDNLNITSNLFSNFSETTTYMINQIQKENFPRDRILIFYAYLAYYVLISTNIDLKKLENSLIIYLKINKAKELKNFTKGFYKLTIPEADFIDLVVRHICHYPGINDYYEISGKKAFLYNYYLATKPIFLKKIIFNITNKKMTSTVINLDYNTDLMEIYYKLVNEASLIIEKANDDIFFKKSHDFINQINTFSKKLVDIIKI